MFIDRYNQYMVKRLCIIAAIISIAFAFCGLFFLDIGKLIYEFQNGPPIVTSGLAVRLQEASKIDSNFHKIYNIGYQSNDYRFPPNISRFKREFENGTGEYLFVTEISNNKFKLRSLAFRKNNIPPEKVNAKLRLLELSVPKRAMNEFEVNSFIDERIFPDTNNRAQKKREILRHIDKLINSKPL